MKNMMMIMMIIMRQRRMRRRRKERIYTRLNKNSTIITATMWRHV
jgi:preprotein translocase subunit YajC